MITHEGTYGDQTEMTTTKRKKHSHDRWRSAQNDQHVPKNSEKMIPSKATCPSLAWSRHARNHVFIFVICRYNFSV